MPHIVSGVGAKTAPAPEQQSNHTEDWPYALGTLVTGIHRVGGYCIRLNCEHHVFEIISEARSVDSKGDPITWGCGLVQAARCLACGYSTSALDAETWWNKATEDLIAYCAEQMHLEAQRLLQDADVMLGILQKPKLRGFV